jgi:hypothetical protein
MQEQQRPVNQLLQSQQQAEFASTLGSRQPFQDFACTMISSTPSPDTRSGTEMQLTDVTTIS